MGIINLSKKSYFNATPDFDQALRTAEMMLVEGADILDVGAIATNPAIDLEKDIPSEQQELDIVTPFVERLANITDKIISVDTYRPTVMQESVKVGAGMINDQHALTEKGALETAIACDVPVCLMHFLRNKDKRQRTKEELLAIVLRDLQEDVARCLAGGVKREHIILDPGFGGGNFGKTATENFYILEHLDEVVALGFPVLVGLSRKSMFGGKAEDRLSATLKATQKAHQLGASIFRVHDVAPCRNAIENVPIGLFF